MWRITFTEKGIRYQEETYSMSEADARESFQRRHPDGKILSIYYDANVSE